jgi:hypothetical protein
LVQFAGQFRARRVRLEDLIPYVQILLADARQGALPTEARSGTGAAEMMKALLAALSGWEQAESAAGKSQAEVALGGDTDLGYLMGVGMAYLQARQKGGDRLDILVDTAIASSPLSKTSCRYQSGKIALRALLEEIGRLPAVG